MAPGDWTYDFLAPNEPTIAPPLSQEGGKFASPVTWNSMADGPVGHATGRYEAVALRADILGLEIELNFTPVRCGDSRHGAGRRHQRRRDRD